MLYIVTNQYGQKELQAWDEIFEESKNFHKLSDDQLAFLQEHPHARVQEIEKCEIFSKYYVVFDQYNRKTIRIFEEDMRDNPSFSILTQQQEEYYLSHPNASIWEIVTCGMPSTPPVEPIIDLDEEKGTAIKEMSAYSLATLGKFVPAYKLANAQCGVYDEAKRQQVIETYKIVGTQCRQLYYDFAEKVALCETQNEIDTLVEQYTKLYNNVCDR